MRLYKKKLLIFIFVAFALIACTNSIEQGPSRQSQTTEGPVRAEAAPVIVYPPSGYMIENGRNGLVLNGTGNLDEKLIGVRVQTSLNSAASLDRLIKDYMSDLPDGWNGVISNESFGGLSARSTGYALEESGITSVTGRAIAVSDGNYDYLVFAVMHQDDWIDAGLDEFNRFVETMEFDDVQVVAETAPRVPQNTPAPTVEPNIEPSELTEIPPFSGQSADGYACVGGFDTSLICILPSGDIHHFTESNSNLDVDSVYDLHACPDGRLLQVDVRGFKLFDGEDFTIIAEPPEEGQADLIRCGPNLEIWAVNFKGVHVHRGAGWETFTKEQIFDDGETLINQIEIAPDGTAWIASFNEVAYLPPMASTWVNFSEGNGFTAKLFLDGLTLDQNGKPVLTHSNGLIWFDDDQWFQLDSEAYWTTSNLAIAPDRQIYITTFSDGLVTTDRQNFEYLTMADGLTRNGHDAIQIDGRGRIWLTHEAGLDVFDGSIWQSLRMDNTALPYNDYLTMVVVGGGPELPEISQEEGGSVVGKLLAPSGHPLVFAAVEMCLSGYVTAFGIQDTPCGDEVAIFFTETDANGRFEINEIPSAWYDLFYYVEENEEWQALYETDAVFLDRSILIESGELLDLGVIPALPKDD